MRSISAAVSGRRYASPPSRVTICRAQATLVRGRGRTAAEDLLPARRHRDAGGLVGTANDDVAQLRQRRDAAAARAAAGVRPLVRLDQIFVRTVGALDECGRDLVLAGLDEHRIREERCRAAAVGGDLRTVLVGEQRHALAVDRNVDVLEARVVAVGERHFERVLAVGREHVIDDHAAARAVRRAFDVIPRVLRDVGLVGVGLVDRRRVLVAHRHAADVAGGVEVRIEQRRRQRLLVGDVVEVRAHRVLRQPVARH